MFEAIIATEYTEVSLSDLFIPKSGNNVYTKEWCQKNKGQIPVYSGNTTGPFDYINTADYDGEYITWSKDGLAGYTMYHNGKFSLTSHRGILIPKGNLEGIDIPYIRMMIEPIFRANIKGRIGINGKNEYTTLNPTMIINLEVKIRIPVKSDGSYDLNKQQEISRKYYDIEQKKKVLLDKLNELRSFKVITKDSEDVKYAHVALNDMITHQKGKAKYTKTWCQKNIGEIPVYSANNKTPFAYTNIADFEGRYLTYSCNGCAGYMSIIEGKFSVNGDRCVIFINAGYEDVDLSYLKCILEPIFRENNKGRFGINGKNEYTKINSTMISALNIKVPIPVRDDGSFDLEKQKDLASKYFLIESIKADVDKKVKDLLSFKIL